jgi:hypothetical protein
MPIHGFPGGVISSTAVTPSVSSASGVWTLDEQLQAGANWPVAPSFASNSVRLRSSASAYMNRTPASAGNQKTFTISFWAKRGESWSDNYVFEAYSTDTNRSFIRFGSDKFIFAFDGSTNNLVTTQVFRDPASWYHFVLAVDTTQATSSNRLKLYVNGTQVTAFDTASYPAQNTNYYINAVLPHNIGRSGFSGGYGYFTGYLTEFNFIDGQALTPNYFGAVDAATGVWEPATYRGTYGTNGFYLPMNQTQNLVSVDYLIVGGGGNAIFGGGGAGGMLSGSSFLAVGTTYTATVGGGGSNSVFNSITATRGGNGGAGGGFVGASGGSGGGGGGANNTTTYAGGAGTAGQGNNGGNGYYQGAGGGGGAGATGGNGTNSGAGVTGGIGGNGGNGSASSITGSSVTYAGGGGGGGYEVSGGSGGSGGGGAGVNSSGTAGNGTANTGGGGGGHPFGSGGSGGSGVVIMRILTSEYSGVTTGSPTVTTDGSYTVVRFTSSGSYTA